MLHCFPQERMWLFSSLSSLFGCWPAHLRFLQGCVSKATRTAGWEIPVLSSRPGTLFSAFLYHGLQILLYASPSLTLALPTFLKFLFLPGHTSWSHPHFPHPFWGFFFFFLILVQSKPQAFWTLGLLLGASGKVLQGCGCICGKPRCEMSAGSCSFINNLWLRCWPVAWVIFSLCASILSSYISYPTDNLTKVLIIL